MQKQDSQPGDNGLKGQSGTHPGSQLEIFHLFQHELQTPFSLISPVVQGVIKLAISTYRLNTPSGDPT